MGTSRSEYLQVSQSYLFTMSSTTAPVNTINKSKEDFIWFVKKAVQDQKSYSYSEMYHCLLKMFVDADTNKDGLVSKASFSKLIDAAASLPRAYGYAPEDSELYKTEAEKDAARQKMFDSMDFKSTGVITFDEWLKFAENTLLQRLQRWMLIPSLTMEVLMTTRSSSRLQSRPLRVPRPWSFTTTCWRSSPNTTWRRKDSSKLPPFHQ